MKKILILALICLLAVSFTISCKPKTKPTPPPPPQAQEQPKVEQVKEETPAREAAHALRRRAVHEENARPDQPGTDL